jgi:hypothetical protein
LPQVCLSCSGLQDCNNCNCYKCREIQCFVLDPKDCAFAFARHKSLNRHRARVLPVHTYEVVPSCVTATTNFILDLTEVSIPISNCVESYVDLSTGIKPARKDE